LVIVWDISFLDGFEMERTYDKIESGKPIIAGFKVIGIPVKIRIYQIKRFIKKYLK